MTPNNRWHRWWRTPHHSSGRVKEKQSTKKTVNRELQCFKRAGKPTDSCERYNGRTTGRKNGGREGKEGGRRPSKADKASQRFWEQGQGKPSTSSRGFIFFPLLSHPERVHLSGFTTTEGRPSPPPVMPNSSQLGSKKQTGSSHRTKNHCQDCKVGPGAV